MIKVLSWVWVIVAGILMFFFSKFAFVALLFLIAWILKMKVVAALFAGFWCLLCGSIILAYVCSGISFLMSKLAVDKRGFKIVVGLFVGLQSFDFLVAFWDKADFNATKGIIMFIYALIGIFFIFSGCVMGPSTLSKKRTTSFSSSA